MDIQKPYKFRKTAPEQPAQALVPKYFYRLEAGEVLTRKEKDELFSLIRSNSGQTNYHILGWTFPFAQFFKTYLVKYKYERNKWIEICSPDKTAIRNCMQTNGDIVKIIELPKGLK